MLIALARSPAVTSILQASGGSLASTTGASSAFVSAPAAGPRVRRLSVLFELENEHGGDRRRGGHGQIRLDPREQETVGGSGCVGLRPMTRVTDSKLAWRHYRPGALRLLSLPDGKEKVSANEWTTFDHRHDFPLEDMDLLRFELDSLGEDELARFRAALAQWKGRNYIFGVQGCCAFVIDLLEKTYRWPPRAPAPDALWTPGSAAVELAQRIEERGIACVISPSARKHIEWARRPGPCGHPFDPQQFGE